MERLEKGPVKGRRFNLYKGTEAELPGEEHRGCAGEES